jgi:predicted kinase
MVTLSQNYRNDDVAELPADVKDYLDKHFLSGLDNLEASNPKLAVFFSGGNAVGKSHLSNAIQQKLDAIVLENDAIKECLMAGYPQLDRGGRNARTWQYSMDLYARLGELTNNGLVVRDGVIDWYFDRILPVFQHAGYQIFVIGYDVSKEKRIQLIQQRGDKQTISTDRLVSLIEEQDQHIARFRAQYTPDVILTDDNMFDYEPVIAKLRQRLTAAK